MRFNLYKPILFISLLTLAVSVVAQAPEAPKASDVRIVIDISGSMKKNDPQNLRRPALDMLVKLLPEGSQAGVWTFGQYVNMLVKHRPVDANWKQEATTKAQTINSVAQFTNIGEALEQAAYDKDYSTRGDYQTHVILLTDGMVDIDRDPVVNSGERNRILNEILPAYEAAGYTIHTVSLSDNADQQLMDRLALATDGKSTVAKTADELMNVFLEVFDQAVPKEELPLEGNSFVTDSSIEEFTALIFPQPGSPEVKIIAPDKATYSRSTQDPSVSWYHTDDYDLVTVKRPLEGEWRVLADLQPQSRITVVSDLSLVVKSLPTNIMVNDSVELSLALREENKVVTRAEFLQLLDIDAAISELGDNTTNPVWSQRLSEGLVPGNGVYTAQLNAFATVGQYQITVDLDGKSFQRRFIHKLNVREPFAIETAYDNQEGEQQYKVTVIPQVQSIDFERTQVVGKLKDPTGSSTIKNFTLTDKQVWELSLTPEQEGTYFLTLRITTTDERGQPRDFIPKPLSFKYPQTDGAFEALMEEPEPATPAPMPTLDEQLNKAPPQPEPAIDEEAEPVIEEEPEEESSYIQWILYGVLGVVNILIILVIYLLYRKMFGKKKTDDEELEEEAADETAAPVSEFDEPPMDEMVVEDLDESDIEMPAEPEPAAPAPEVAADDDDPLADLAEEAAFDLDKDAEDEDPEFSLDDFAPDSLDDDEEQLKSG